MSVATRRPPRGLVVGMCVLAGLLVVAMVRGRPGRDGPPLDPRSDGPLGTSALVSLIEGLGGEVDLSVGLPGAGDDAALVLQDRLDEGQADDLAAWVRAGGRAIVTDPASPFTPRFEPPGLDEQQRTVDPETCTIDALAEVDAIEAGAAGRYDVAESDALCFGSRADGAFVVSWTEGRGTWVAIAGAAFVTNDLLDERDNAVLAAALLVPTDGTVVRFVEPPVPAGGGDKTLADLVPVGLKRGLLQLAMAFVLYALWRAIRLGRPVLDEQPVELEGSALVSATGRLLSRTRSPGVAADTLRADLRHALRARLGVPATADHATLARLVAERSGVEVERVLEAVDDRPVRSDAELVAVARAVSSIHQEVLQ